jgi:hypothetical protein
MVQTVQIERTLMALQTGAVTHQLRWLFKVTGGTNPHCTALQAASQPSQTRHIARWLPDVDSNHDRPVNSRASCRWTIGEWWVIGESNSAGVLLQSRPLPEPHPNAMGGFFLPR